MSEPVVECVPNFSEGRDPEVLASLRLALSEVPGATLLDVHTDPWHARSVFTVAGARSAVAEAAFRGARAAAELIDLTRHHGEHPRIGAADVVPFVPLEGMELGGLRGAGMEACVRLARETGRRIAEELEVPVYLYGRAARRPEREQLASIRRGGFEGLRDAIREDPERAPDFGPRELHPTAGATAVGARDVLVAYNIFLDTHDPEPARAIARRIRTSDGGLPAVQALGFLVSGRAQVSTNLLDVGRTSPKGVFDAVRREAESLGVEVTRSEIVGLLPEEALPPDPERALLLREPAGDKALERRIREALGG